MEFNTGRTYYDSVKNDYIGEDTPDGDILACTNPGKLFYLSEIEGV